MELSKVVPDGLVCFFVSYLYMDQIISQWSSMKILDEIMQNKLIFIETQVRLISILLSCRMKPKVLQSSHPPEYMSAVG